MHILNDFLILWKELSDQFVQLDLVDPVLREVNLEGVPQGHHLQLGELVLLNKKCMAKTFPLIAQFHLFLCRLFDLFLILLCFLLLILVFFWLEKSDRRYEVPENLGQTRKM